MSEKSAIENDIRRANNKISDLKKKKKEYENLKRDINKNILCKLSTSKSNLFNSISELKKALVSNVSREQQKILQNCQLDIDDMNSELKNKILPEIDKIIDSIERDIRNQKGKISDLNEKLESLPVEE